MVLVLRRSVMAVGLTSGRGPLTWGRLLITPRGRPIRRRGSWRRVIHYMMKARNQNSKEVGYLKEEVFLSGGFWLADLGGSRRSELMTFGNTAMFAGLDIEERGNRRPNKTADRQGKKYPGPNQRQSTPGASLASMFHGTLSPTSLQATMFMRNSVVLAMISAIGHVIGIAGYK